MIEVSILGATGMVGQRFVQLLSHHPDFKVVALFASDRRKGEKFSESVQWMLGSDIPEEARDIRLNTLSDDVPTKIVFSALPSKIAKDVEEELSAKGHYVFSNASAHRYDEFVPIMVPEVNSGHFKAVKYQNKKGFIITNPNCSTAGIVIPLKAIQENFGIKRLLVFTMQAISGAGYPGVPALSIYDNVIPFIESEEDKVKTETRKILGEFDGKFLDAPFDVEARCNRVPVRNGHMEELFIDTEDKTNIGNIKRVLSSFSSIPQELNLPTAPKPAIILKDNLYSPQPILDRDSGKGMAITVGNVRESKMFTFTMTVLSHNTIRGAAGGSVLNAELLLEEGKLDV
jgi:aspartate-semialdehyde dehydrogenase